jgi:hypothetical protein
LFSSIVASFIIEIYKTLLPGNGQQTAGSPSSNAVRINIVLFLSFFLSIMSAVSCALIQQWCNEYQTFAYPRAAPHESGRVRTYLFQGLHQFQIRRFMYGTHVLLHISVFLFFWAISDFFYTVDRHFGAVARYALVASGIFYILLSISPLVFSNSPYNTPMTPLLRAIGIILRIVIRSPLWCLRWYHRLPFDIIGLPYYKGIHFDRAHLYSIKAEELAEKLEFFALEWLFTANDFSDNDMDKFLEGLPGYMSSSHTKKGQLDQYLTAEHILSRIKEHFITCATSMDLSDEARFARVSSCVETLQLIFQYSRDFKKDYVPDKLDEELRSQRAYIQRLMDDFQKLCDMDDQMIALRASCIRALAVQDFLSPFDLQYGETTDSPPFPVFLIPIYKFFFVDDNSDTMKHLDRGDPPSVMETKRMMWKSLLHDGPLANLTTLGRAVLEREHALPSTLSFCWKALEELSTQLEVIHSEEPTRAQSNFDKLHENTRTYVLDEERGSRVTPLLDILDTVGRGRRLLMVFSSHPDSEYHNRVEVVFGEEYLRNGDLLEAFADCLPVFISKHSRKVCRDFMEKVVRHDDLWTSLQENLWNTQKSDSPTPEKLRVFEDCCTVLDIAFSVLEDSHQVDWSAPEFESLAEHFESFITYCSQVMGRATSFRVGIIRARICKVLLAQFSNDKSFRSEWDVASLSRLIYTLGLDKKEDAEFWDSHANGGHIGAEFTAKAREMIDITARDGPLLIFCQLGRLAAMAVPINQSGLESEDIGKVWELQRKGIENTRLPLNRASGAVWEALGQLRKQVDDLRDNNTGKDNEILQRLLRMIDDVYNPRSSGSVGPAQSEPAEDQGTSVVVNPTLPSGESRAATRHFSFASDSTAVTGGRFSSTLTSEGEGGFGGASSVLIPRVSIDLQPESSGNNVLDRERKTRVRSPSPQRYVSGSHGVSSRYLTVQGTPSHGVGITDRSIGTFPSTIYPPYMGDARQRRPTRRIDSGFSATRQRQSLVTRAGTSGLFTSRRDVPTVLLNPMIPAISPIVYGSLDPGGEGKSGAAPIFEKE